MLKSYTASYFKSGSWGSYEYHSAVVIANEKEEALGLILENYNKTNAQYWNIEEIDVSKLCVIEIDSHSD